RGQAFGPLTAGVAATGRLASVFCIPRTPQGLVNAAADLPGPGALTLPGTFLPGPACVACSTTTAPPTTTTNITTTTTTTTTPSTTSTTSTTTRTIGGPTTTTMPGEGPTILDLT